MAASLPWPLLQSRGITVIAIGETYRLVAASKLVVRVGARAAAHAAAFSLSAVSEATRHFGQGLVRATIEALDGGFKIVDANKQAIAYVYGHADSHDAEIANRQAANLARQMSLCVFIGAGVFGVVIAFFANIPVVGFMWSTRLLSGLPQRRYPYKAIQVPPLLTGMFERILAYAVFFWASRRRTPFWELGLSPNLHLTGSDSH